MSTEERFNLERQYRDYESTQARFTGRPACLADRLKFACCHRCGSADGMQAVHRATLMEMTDIELSWLTWYSDGGRRLFYPCPICNRDGVIPGCMKLVGGILSVRIWCSDNKPDDDPMAPDYEALTRKEPVLASEDSRDSAGMEG